MELTVFKTKQIIERTKLYIKLFLLMQLMKFASLFELGKGQGTGLDNIIIFFAVFTNDNNIESIDCPATEREREKTFTLTLERDEILKRFMLRNLRA